MTVYAEASALLKIYVDEHDSPRANELLEGRRWTSGSHTYVEVRRNLARLLSGAALDDSRRAFLDAWSNVDVVQLTETVVEASARAAETTGARTLDALHLGAASVAGAADGLPVVTFDRRLADAARSLGWTVLGAE